MLNFDSPSVIKPKIVKYSMKGDIKSRLCAHLDKTMSDCPDCSTGDFGSMHCEMDMTVPLDYPNDTVDAIAEYGDFITLFDSLL